MKWLLIQILILQVLVPLMLLIWLARTREKARFNWLLKTIMVLSYLTSIAVAGIWPFVPWPYMYLSVAILLAMRGGWRIKDTPWLDVAGPRSHIELVGLLVTSLASVAMSVYLFSGRIPQAGSSINLTFPLQQGNYIVVHGGSNAILNPHLKTLAPTPRFVPWRGQSYAIDVVKINHWGLRANGILPTDLKRYEIFGDSVFAPCTGKVVSAENDRPDMPVPIRDPDRTKLTGNHVLLECDGIEILLAHFQHSSVAVKVGDRVVVGDFLGLVGNSGNTTEPHLHISAQRRKPGQALIGGEPVVMLFNGNYLVRNERITRYQTESYRQITQ